MMKRLAHIVLAACSACLLVLPAFAEETAAERPASSSGERPGVIERAGNATKRGAEAAGRGIERGGKATGRGLKKAATATEKGVKRGAEATGRGLKKAGGAVEKTFKGSKTEDTSEK